MVNDFYIGVSTSFSYILLKKRAAYIILFSLRRASLSSQVCSITVCIMIPRQNVRWDIGGIPEIPPRIPGGNGGILP